MVVVVRFVDGNWHLQRSVVRLMLLAKSLKGEEVARQLIMCLSNQLGITSNQLVAAMRDRASVNNVAIQTSLPIYSRCGVFSHTIDHVGEKINTHILDEFVKGWIGLFMRSPKTKLAWKETTGLPVPTYSTTRWWSKWEVMKQLMDAFGDVHHFLENSDLLNKS